MTSIKIKQSKNNNVLLFFFCLWAFILMGRPQDYLPALNAFRPVILSSAIMLFVFFLNIKKNNGPDLLDNKQIKYYLLLYVVMIIGVPVSLYVRMSFEAVITGYILTVIFVLLFFKIVHTITALKKVLLTACFGGGLYFFMAIRAGLGDFSRLAFGNMFDPNDLAYFALVFLPIFYLFFGSENKIIVRVATIIFFSSGVLLILLSGSRGGVLAFGIALVVFLMMTHTIKKSAKLIVLVLCLVFVAIAPLNIERYSTMLNLEDDYNVTAEGGRIDLWKIGMRAFADNPFTGVGVGGYPIAVGLDRQSREATTQAWQTAHNSIIQIGTETGIFGLLLYCLLSINVFSIFYKVKKRSRQLQLVKVAEVGLVGFCGMFIASMFLSQAYSVYWAFYVVFSAVVYQLYQQELTSKISPEKRPQRATR